MEKTYKRVPFDLELAKKIQSGEIEGRIVLEFNSRPIRIICLDKKSDTNKVVGLIEKDGIEYLAMYSENGVCNYIDELNSCYRNRLLIELPEEAPEEQHPIEELDLYHAGYKVGFEAGRCMAFRMCYKKEAPKYDDVEEVPTGDGSIVFLRHKKPEFKPFDKVLVRNRPEMIWSIDLYSHHPDKSDLYVCIGGAYEQCIPYKGNEHLVGTSYNPE